MDYDLQFRMDLRDQELRVEREALLRKQLERAEDPSKDQIEQLAAKQQVLLQALATAMQGYQTNHHDLFRLILSNLMMIDDRLKRLSEKSKIIDDRLKQLRERQG